MLARRREWDVDPDGRRALLRVLDRPRYEVLPLPGIEDDVCAHLPRHSTVTVTASPRRGLGATLEVARTLSLRGRTVVPHLSARMLTDEAHLKDTLDALLDAGIREVFVVGGDQERPSGAFTGSLDVLVAMSALGYDLVVGIAGYPESHPKISDDVTVQAMWDKRHHASYLVSQVCFDADVVGGWVERVRRRGVLLPVHVGVPGPATTGHLLRLSRRIGVGESARFLVHHGAGFLRLARPGEWRPDALLAGLAPYFAQPYHRLAGVHVYTFNEVAAAEHWRQLTVERLQEAA